MRGIDVSHWQGVIDWKNVDVDFVIIKASQGVSFVDDRLDNNKAGARKKGLAIGYYHFADGGDAIKEADFFIKTVGDIALGEFLVLDWEIQHSDPAGWCKKFLDRVTDKVGFKPLIYLNASTVKSVDWRIVAESNYGLWIARYGDNDDQAEDWEIPSTDEWKFFALWQFSSTGKVSGVSGRVDLNTTSMDVATLKKYGKQKELVSEVDYKTLYEEEKKKREEAEKIKSAAISELENMKKMIMDIVK